MDQKMIVELLRSVPLFSSLPDHDLSQVADRTVPPRSRGTATSWRISAAVGTSVRSG
jgi:hypothetical protein